MRLVWVVIPLVLIGIVGIQESFAETDTKYKPPYQQIRDDGIHPVDIKCNEGKVLFFKFLDGSPVCIFEDSIKKLVSTERVFFGWNPKANLVDSDYIQNKMKQLDFGDKTLVTISNLNAVHLNSTIPLITLIQEYISDPNLDVLFFNNFSTKSGEITIEPNELLHYVFDDPRRYSYSGLRDIGYTLSFECNDMYQREMDTGNLEINLYRNIDKLILTSNIKSQFITPDNLTNSNSKLYQFQFGSLFPTQFESDPSILIHDISEIQCVPKDTLFASVFPFYYYYTVSFEIPNTIEVTK